MSVFKYWADDFPRDGQSTTNTSIDPVIAIKM